MALISTFSDEELLHRLSVGDATALEAMIRRYHAILCQFAEKFLPDAALAQDIAQETFIKLWKSGKSFESMGALKAYLYAMTRNGCLDMIRCRSRLDERHKRAVSPDDEVVEPVLAEIVRAESLALIYEVVHSMPDKMQQVFFLSFREGMTVSEIAVHLGLQLKAVKKQKYKALVALRGRFSRDPQILLGALVAMEMMGSGRA